MAHGVSPPGSCATRRSRSTTRSRAGQQTLSNLAAYVTEIVRKGVEGLMAGKVFFQRDDVAGRGSSAPRGAHWTTRMWQRWMAQWMELPAVDIPASGSSGRNLKARRGRRGRARQTTSCGRRSSAPAASRDGASAMFDLGEQAWPEEAPFHTPVFGRERTKKRDPWERAVRDHLPLRQRTASRPRARTRPARPPATGTSRIGGRRRNDPGVRERRPDRRVSRSRSQPVLFGSGIRLFEGVDAGPAWPLEPVPRGADRHRVNPP